MLKVIETDSVDKPRERYLPDSKANERKIRRPMSAQWSNSLDGNSSLGHSENQSRWNEKAGPLAGCDTLPMRKALEVQSKGDRP